MPSKARRAFDENAKDVSRLLELHRDLGGASPGRRYGLEVLNKSAIVLVTAFWEAYCEDLAAEALDLLVRKAADAAAVPKELRKRVAKDLRGDPNEIAPWDLAGEGWRTVLKGRLSQLREERNRSLNTPKAARVDELFERALGFKQISASWYWQGMSAAQARKKLDGFVELRGSIAHRGSGGSSVKKTQVTDYFAFVKRLASKTGGRVNKLTRSVAGEGLW